MTSDDLQTRSFENTKKFAKESDLDLYIPDDYTFVIDIDDEISHAKYWKNKKILEDVIEFEFIKKTESRSESHYHIYHRTKEKLDNLKRLLLQLLLASDSSRECHSYVNHLRGEQIISPVFERRKP